MGFFSKVIKAITGAIGDVIGWITGIEEPDFESTQRGFLVNKQSNDAAIPVIYGERKIGGTRVFVSTSGSKNKYLYVALVLCEGEVEAIGDVYINDTISTDAKFSGLVTIQKFTGTDDQTSSTILAEADDTWGTNHRLRGVAYIAAKFQYDQDVFSGMPTIECIVQGRKVYDPRTATTAYSTNPALCLRDFLTNPRYGKGLASALIDDDSFEDAADVCDTLVTQYTGAGSTQKLFECNAIIDTSQKLFDNVKRILSGMRGLMPYSNGIYSLIIEKDESSTFDLTAENITSEIQLTSANKNKKYNKVVVKFVNPDANWQTDSAFWPPSGSSEETAFLAADNDQELSTEVTLNTITNYYSARDIARIICLASRENELTANLTATSEAFAMAVGDVCRLEHESMGWTGTSRQLFRVVAMQLMDSGEAKLTLQQYTSTIYPWAEGAESEVNQESTLPDPLDIAAPTGLSVTETTFIADDGTVQPSLLLEFTNESGFAIEFEVQWRTGSDEYQSAFTAVEQYEIKGLQTGATYDIRVRAINTVGVRSAFASISRSAAGDETPPSLPTSYAATGGQGVIALDWTNPTERDFSNVVVYRSATSGGTYVAVASVSGGFGKNSSFTNGGLDDSTTYFYKLSSVDHSGNESAQTAFFSATTDAPAQPPRASKGYVYYTIASATSPATPSASSYNYDTAVLTGLTSGWQQDPVTIDGSDGKYWAASYVVVEDTFGGSQTITFSSPFSSYNFDGLVTFTNLNNELADPNSTEITTIDGGLVKTGTLDVGLVNIAGTSASGIDVKSAATGSRMELTSSTIKIFDGSTLRVKIGDLT
jgi:hypothetical protein